MFGGFLSQTTTWVDGGRPRASHNRLSHEMVDSMTGYFQGSADDSIRDGTECSELKLYCVVKTICKEEYLRFVIINNVYLAKSHSQERETLLLNCILRCSGIIFFLAIT